MSTSPGTSVPAPAARRRPTCRLKFVAHVGDVATQTIRDRLKLVGIDVILIHRLLKNPVTVPEYVLLSEDLYGTGTALTGPVHEVSLELEGIGPARGFYLDVADLDALAAASDGVTPAGVTWRGRLGRTAFAAGAGLPYMVGLRRRRSHPGPASQPGAA